MSTTFIAKIKDKDLDFGSPTNLARWLDFLRENEGKYVKITKPQVKRSLQQNSFYWMYLEIIARETGNNAEELHEYFKQKLLPRRYAVIKGKCTAHEVLIPKSTTDLTKTEMGDYIDKISAMTEVPIPDTETYKNYYNEAPTI